MLQQEAELLVLDTAEITQRVHAAMAEYRARTDAATHGMSEMLFASHKALDRSRTLLATLAASSGRRVWLSADQRGVGGRARGAARAASLPCETHFCLLLVLPGQPDASSATLYIAVFVSGCW